MLGARFAPCVPIALAIALASPPAPAEGKLALPEPAMPPPRTIAERGESPVYYRLPDDTLRGSVRLNLGTATRAFAADVPSKTAFALDALVGAALAPARGSRFTLVGEGGYSFVGFGEHFATAGLGPLLRVGGPVFGDGRSFGDTLWVGLVPRGMVGVVHGDFAAGVRTAALFGYEGWGLEVAHQWVTSNGQSAQELHLGLVMFFLYPARYE